MADLVEQCRRNGRKAARNGKRADDNPFSSGECAQFLAWREGWKAEWMKLGGWV